MASFNKGDAAGLAPLYTEHGQVLPSNSDFVMGRQVIQMFWQTLMDMGTKAAKLEIGEVEGYGDTIIEVSKYTLQGGEGAGTRQGQIYCYLEMRERAVETASRHL